MFVTYAQNLEDAALWRALKHVEGGFYVDVGANDPVLNSVSKAFYDRGWRGIHIEPVPECARRLREARPDEPVIEKAVGAEAGTSTLYVLSNTELSSLVEENTRRAVELHDCKQTELQVDIVTLESVLAPYAGRDIHWLKIDVEGGEREVLRGWNSQRDRPWIMVVEATKPGDQTPTYTDWEPFLLAADYAFVYFDGLSRFYVANEHREIVTAFQTPPNVFDEIVPAKLFELAKDNDSLRNRLSEAQSTLTSMESFLVGAQRRLADANDRLLLGEESAAHRASQLAEMQICLDEREAELVNARNATGELMQRLEQIQTRQMALLSSTSWRLTKPIRIVSTGLRKLGKAPKKISKLIVRIINLSRSQSISSAQGLDPPPTAEQHRLETSSLAPAPRIFEPEMPPSLGPGNAAKLPLDHALEPVVALGQMRQGASSLCFVLPVIDADRLGLERSIQSVLRQTEQAWELLLVADASHRNFAEEWLDVDWRIRVINPNHDNSSLTSVAEFATSEFLGTIRQGDTLDDELVRLISRRVQREPDIDIIYTDEICQRADPKTGDPFYKPDWSPEHLDSVNYIGRFYSIRKSLLLDMLPPVATAPEAASYELLLEATLRARRISHIDEPLYIGVAAAGREQFGGFFPADALPGARDALERKVRRENPLAKVNADQRIGALDVEWPIPPGIAVTLVILTALTERELPGRGKTILITNFVRSIINSSDYAGYTILVVDDGEIPEDLAMLLATHGHRSRSYTRTGPFSFAHKANFAVGLVDDGIVLLLNDDLEVISRDWIQRLAGLVARPAIGVAGARLLFSDGTIQHSGIVVGFHGSAGHIFHRAECDGHEYAGFASVLRNFSAVTGAVMAFRKRVFDELGGFDERLAIDYNDVDFCLRCIEAGYRIAQAPAATLYHFHNSSLRRQNDSAQDFEPFRARWSHVIDRDPYYSKHFQTFRDDRPILENTADDRSNVPQPADETLALTRTVYEDLLARFERDAVNALATMNLGWIPAASSHRLTQQIRTILRLGLFDRAFYLSTYPDVRAAGIDPLEHYVRWGDAEGRQPNPLFDPRFYRKRAAQLRQTNFLALYHYAVVGEADGESPSILFNPQSYLASNPEIAPWLDHQLTHFLWLGRPAGLPFKTRLQANQRVVFDRCSEPKSVDTNGLCRTANIIGPLDKVSGLGVSARGYLEAVTLTGFGPVGARVETREFGIQKSIQNRPKFVDFIPNAAVNIIHMNGDTLPAMLERDGTKVIENRYNIAVWYWELATFRPEWHTFMKIYHEFWAPSDFIARTLRRCTDKPVRLVPPYLPYLQRMTTGERDPSRPHFVYCFDANSILERKNPGALLEAFQLAFPKGSNARLTFKITYPNRGIADVERLYAARDDDPRIAIIDDILSDTEIHELIGSATAYVSPHRSEGLGLTVIEAMAAMVPVIATPYGGIDQFVTPDTAYPIDFRMVELTGNYEPYPRGFVWTNPDVVSLARLLRDVVERPAVASARALEARSRVLDVFASPALIETYRCELDRIGRQLFGND